MRAVRFDQYGPRDVLHVAEVETPTAGPGRVLVKIVAAAINPGESYIREGHMHERFPATFPSGLGTDLAGVVAAVGDGVAGFAEGDEVYGWSWERSSQAEYAAIPAEQLVHRPAGLGWLEAATVGVAGTTAWAAVEAVDPQAGETVVVSAAAGGVGVYVVGLLRERGVRTIGIASAANHDFLTGLGVVPVAYGPTMRADVEAAAPGGVDALIDLFGPEYIDLALDLGVAPERIDSIISFERASEVGAKLEGSAEGTRPEVIEALGQMIADGRLHIPIAATFPLEQVQDAFALLEARHTRGKVVLMIDPETLAGTTAG